MLLVADSGSTKTEWCIFSDGRSDKYMTQGMSPYFQTIAQIKEIVTTELLSSMKTPELVSDVYYYGTGCNVPANIDLLSSALQSCFINGKIHVADDLVGSARAVCRSEEGVVCILGTGSNSGYYDGVRIVVSRPGLGFILGDEGSGSYLGKKLVRACLNGLLPDELYSVFEQRFKTSQEELLRNVYIGQWPNRYLAGFSRFLYENRGNTFVEKILADGFNDFIQLHLLSYSQIGRVPVHFVGSIASCYQDVLKKLCTDNKINVGKIISSPIDGMLDFHKTSCC